MLTLPAVESDGDATFDPELLLIVLSEVRAGDFTARMPVHWTGMAGKIADGLNEMIGANQALGTELERVSRVVGKEGKLSHRASFKGTNQIWGSSLDHRPGPQLSLQVVAEGVENETTMNMLIEHGCDLAQGYHFGRPVPDDNLVQWLESSPYGMPRGESGPPPVLVRAAQKPAQGTVNKSR